MASRVSMARSRDRDLDNRDDSDCKFLGMFDEMDLDKSGSIEWDELQQGAQRRLLEWGPRRALDACICIRRMRAA